MPGRISELNRSKARLATADGSTDVSLRLTWVHALQENKISSTADMETTTTNRDLLYSLGIIGRGGGLCFLGRTLGLWSYVVQSSLMYFGIGKQLLEPLKALRGDARVEKFEGLQ